MRSDIVDVLVHIDEDLGLDRLKEVEDRIATEEGVISACGRDDKPHLVVVTYNPEVTDSIAILHKVEQQGCHAELVGL